MQSFYRWAVVPEWCRCLFFYDAAVFLYSSIERNDTRNFREKKIFRVALSGTLEVKRVNHILYIICLYIIYSHIIYIYNIVFCSCSFSLMFYGINFLRPASGCFLYLVSKGRSTGCARNDNSVSISFPTVYQKSIGTKTQLLFIFFFFSNHSGEYFYFF